MRHGLFATLFSRKFNSISCRANDKPVYIRSRHNSSTLIISRSFVPSPHLSASLRIPPHLSASNQFNFTNSTQPSHLCYRYEHTNSFPPNRNSLPWKHFLSLSPSFYLSLSFSSPSFHANYFRRYRSNFSLFPSFGWLMNSYFWESVRATVAF